MDDTRNLHAARLMKVLTAELVAMFEGGLADIPPGQVRLWDVPVSVAQSDAVQGKQGAALTGTGHLMLIGDDATAAATLTPAELVSLGLALICAGSSRMADEALANMQAEGTA